MILCLRNFLAQRMLFSKCFQFPSTLLVSCCCYPLLKNFKLSLALQKILFNIEILEQKKYKLLIFSLSVHSSFYIQNIVEELPLKNWFKELRKINCAWIFWFIFPLEWLSCCIDRKSDLQLTSLSVVIWHRREGNVVLSTKLGLNLIQWLLIPLKDHQAYAKDFYENIYPTLC